MRAADVIKLHPLAGGRLCSLQGKQGRRGCTEEPHRAQQARRRNSAMACRKHSQRPQFRPQQQLTHFRVLTTRMKAACRRQWPQSRGPNALRVAPPLAGCLAGRYPAWTPRKRLLYTMLPSLTLFYVMSTIPLRPCIIQPGRPDTGQRRGRAQHGYTAHHRSLKLRTDLPPIRQICFRPEVHHGSGRFCGRLAKGSQGQRLRSLQGFPTHLAD